MNNISDTISPRHDYESERCRDLFYLIKMHYPSIYDNYFIYKIPRIANAIN